MNKKTILTIIKLLPVIAAVLSFILVFSPVDAGGVTVVTVLLASLGFVAFFLGRKESKEDKTLKILGILDLLATVSIILMYVIVFIAIAKGITDTADVEDDSYSIAAEDFEMGSFESVDLNGNEVSESIFAEKDVTVLNVWATFCGPCKAEMPELAKFEDEFPGNVQVVGVVIDAPTSGTEGKTVDTWDGDTKNINKARKICDETGVKYTNILASESVSDIFDIVVAVPTTFIVDKEGKLVCDPIVGADVEAYKKAVEDYLSKL